MQTHNQKQMETFIIVALLHSQSCGGSKGSEHQRLTTSLCGGGCYGEASYLKHTPLFQQEIKLSFCPLLLHQEFPVKHQ